MRRIITSLCEAGCQTRSWFGPALHGINAGDQETWQYIMDETLGIAPSDLNTVVRLPAPELQRFAHGISEADLCVQLIQETAIHEMDLVPAYRFVADVCRRDLSDRLTSDVLNQLNEERANAVNEEIARQNGLPALPLPQRHPRLFDRVCSLVSAISAAETSAATA